MAEMIIPGQPFPQAALIGDIFIDDLVLLLTMEVSRRVQELEVGRAAAAAIDRTYDLERVPINEKTIDEETHVMDFGGLISPASEEQLPSIWVGVSH